MPIQQSLLASQPPQTPFSTAKQNPNCSLRRSPRLACSGTQSSARFSSQSLAAQVISKHLSASKAPQRRCGTQLSIASFLLTSKRTSSTQDSVQGSQNSPEIVPSTSKKAKNTVPVTTPQLLLPPGSVIDIHEARALDYQMENHRIFMSQPENKEYLWLVFGRQRLNQLQAILESPNNTLQYLGDRFRVYDMYSQKMLADGVTNIKFMKPQTFSYLQQFGYNSCADLRTGDCGSISHCFWPINCTPTHWSCAVHGMEDNAPIVYMDTIGCLSTIKGKCPRDFVLQLSKLIK